MTRVGQVPLATASSPHGLLHGLLSARESGLVQGALKQQSSDTECCLAVMCTQGAPRMRERLFTCCRRL